MFWRKIKDSQSKKLSLWRESGLDSPEFWGLRGEPRSQSLATHPLQPHPGQDTLSLRPEVLLTSVVSCFMAMGRGRILGGPGSRWARPSASFHHPHQQALSQDALPSVCPRENKLQFSAAPEDQPAGPGVFISAHSDPKSRSTLSATRGQQWPGSRRAARASAASTLACRVQSLALSLPGSDWKRCSFSRTS